MDLLKLVILFAVIILVLWMKRPLWQAVLAGLVVMAAAYQIGPGEWPALVANVFIDWNSFSILVSLYLITYLQRMLESRSQIKLAQQDLDGLFHNRRITAVGSALFIGLLPSAAAMILCGDIVKGATEGYLKPKEQAFVTSWFRHIPESTLPTYAGVLLMASISGVPLGQFILGMIIPMIVLSLLGVFPYLMRVPKDPGTPRSKNRKKDLLNLFRHLWTLILILVLILVFKLSVVPAVAIVIGLAIFVYRFRVDELVPMSRSAFEVKLLLNTFLVLVLKEFIVFSGMLTTLPQTLSTLPIPDYLVFAILFLIGGIVSGSNGIIAMGAPIAFATVQGGMPFMVLLMCVAHGASQISPTHVCIVVAADYFNITLGELIRKTIPVVIVFTGLMLAYYHLLLVMGF
ncbi:MAG: DUF401 family protein [Veillonella sp.]|uniref:DUF401 family protein n=1 Tax=Veillonella sp. TaxID=1926307 RepID=UPI0025E1C91C|nr:DUF401 family protein [Veillonella sp.]MBS4914108.1 DUF401 family protein [Veillonella sp.]